MIPPVLAETERAAAGQTTEAWQGAAGGDRADETGAAIDGQGPIDAGRRNFMLLVQLRWLAVGGQLATVLAVRFLFGIPLPLVPMIAALGVLVVLNIVASSSRWRWPTTNRQLLGGLLVDVACLTVQLYLSGGATNPFVTLYLLQVVIGAVLLEAWSSWTLVGVTSAAFAAIVVAHRPVALPAGYASRLSEPFLWAGWFNFTLTAVLLVAFVTRIARNLHDRDAHLAELRQRAAEEEHIVRMGLLASGAAHELGTPLASIAVALGDWRGEPAIAASPHLAVEVEEMRAEVARCKEILGGILFAAGEVTGQAPARTTLRRFVLEIVADRERSDPDRVTLDDRLGPDLAIVADRALAQALTNILDNAVEAGAQRIAMRAERQGGMLILAIRDDGSGFADDILAHVGQPYRSTKTRQGAGLGLFLSHNVLRTLGGTLEARNPIGGGAEVTLRLPLASLALAA